MDATRAALVVGAHEFVDPKFQGLRSPATDVEALARVLEETAIGGFEVKTVLNQASSVVQQALERFFSNRRPDDLLLLYFSCHGVKDPSGRLHFVTTNTTFDLLRSTGISASFVSEQMEYSRSKRIVVLLDCCYSGAFLKGFRARGDDSVAVDQLEGRGRAVITASRATEYAFEADELASANAQPSMFTGAIVEGLATGNADANGDGLVTVDELYDYVYDSVRGRVAGQTPGRWMDVEGDLVVARNPSPRLRPAAVPPELQRAIESDAALQRLGAVAELVDWHRGDDEGRRLAAATALEQMSRDYDDRVRKAAVAGLGPTPSSAPAAPAPVAPQPAAAGPIPAIVPTPAEAPAEVAAEVPTPPAPAVAADRLARTAAILAMTGAVGVLLSPYTSYIDYGDYSSALGDREWFSLGALAVFGLVVLAAVSLLGWAGSRVTGLTVLTGMLPIATAWSLVTLGELVHKDEVTRPQGGWLLLEGGLVLIAAAGVMSSLRWRSLVPMSAARPAELRRPETASRVVAGLLLGVTASLAWAIVFSYDSDAPLGVVPPVLSFVVRLTVLSAVVFAVARSIPVAAGTKTALAMASVAAVIALLLTSEELSPGDSWAFLLALVAVVLGAVIMPLLAATVVPGRIGCVLLAAWASATAAWLPSIDTGDSTLLVVAVVATGALAAYLLRAADRVPAARA